MFVNNCTILNVNLLEKNENGKFYITIENTEDVRNQIKGALELEDLTQKDKQQLINKIEELDELNKIKSKVSFSTSFKPSTFILNEFNDIVETLPDQKFINAKANIILQVGEWEYLGKKQKSLYLKGVLITDDSEATEKTDNIKKLFEDSIKGV